jgi:hypothetical protein
MLNEYNLGQLGTLTPEDYAQQQQLNRQQQMAQLLLQQGVQQPQGQMVSGRYVPTSFFQNLAPLANIAASQYIGNKADAEAAKLAERIRQGKATAEEKITNLTFGTSATPAVMGQIYNPKGELTKETTADMFNADMSLNPQYKKVGGTDYKPATTPDLAAALRAINDPYSYGAGKELKPLIYKQLMPDPTELERNWKAAQKQGYQGTINDYKNQMSDFQQAELRNQNIRIGLEQNRAAFEGIPTSGGGVSTPTMNQPTMSQPVINQPTSGSPVIRGNAPPVSIAPNAPAYAQNSVTMNTNAGNLPVVPTVNMPGVSPKKQAEMAATQAETLQTNVKNAYTAYPVIKEIQDLLPKSSSGFFQRSFTGATRGFGISTDMSKADAQLDLLAPKLTMLQPRFEGPQGVQDVKLYEAAAGRVADTSLPYEDRMAALGQLKNIYQQYAPNLDWSYSVKPTPIPSSNNSSAAAPSSAPAGVDPVIWNVMTPSEKSLWQKR